MNKKRLSLAMAVPLMVIGLAGCGQAAKNTAQPSTAPTNTTVSKTAPANTATTSTPASNSTTGNTTGGSGNTTGSKAKQPTIPSDVKANNKAFVTLSKSDLTNLSQSIGKTVNVVANMNKYAQDESTLSLKLMNKKISFTTYQATAKKDTASIESALRQVRNIMNTSGNGSALAVDKDHYVGLVTAVAKAAEMGGSLKSTDSSSTMGDINGKMTKALNTATDNLAVYLENVPDPFKKSKSN